MRVPGETSLLSSVDVELYVAEFVAGLQEHISDLGVEPVVVHSEVASHSVVRRLHQVWHLHVLRLLEVRQDVQVTPAYASNQIYSNISFLYHCNEYDLSL